ncbi:MFS transporter [Halalkalibacterium halodurans]|uniref:MFS transporter n=1 Tax=Halalkalibacterium halodurans TaxID=86665 RepID=A0A0M0KJW0_ALKHA|nr:MFS transporter [Halalkalibacterium halodurans]TPE68680.1 MFS transporter [Halalkalibacterium halodurans]
MPNSPAQAPDPNEQQTGRIQEYIHSPIKQKILYKRTLLIVIMSQIFGGAGLAAGVTVGALLAQDMLGGDRYAGIPAALLTLGSAAAAFFVGRLSDQFGRRIGLGTGFLLGGVGAIIVIYAAVSNSVILLFLGLLLNGAGNATNLQARYAGTDLAKPKQRATAISMAMVATTFGAVAGPNLVNVMGNVAGSFGVPTLAGPFILATVAYLLAGFIFFAFLRPDPFLVAKAIVKQEADHEKHNHSTQTTEKPLTEKMSTIAKRGIIVGTTVMVLTQMVMVAIMTMTPVHMQHHGHGLQEIGLVISIHIGAMYLPSLVTGVLVDKLGRTTMSVTSGVILLSAGLLAAVAPGDSLAVLIIALALLGLGWNLGLISGTAMIVDATHPATRAKTQGTIDVLVGLSGAAGGALSGMVVAQSSYATLSLAGGRLALALVPVMIWYLKKNARAS